MRRRRRDNPLSLFSFQDIITGLCGIMIFMVLVQVCGMTTKDCVAPSATVDSFAEAEESLDTLRAEIAALEKKLAAVKARAAQAIVAVPIKDRAAPGEADKLDAKLTEREQTVAALVSQVHDLETQVEAARKSEAEDAERVREMERTRRLLEQQLTNVKGKKGVTLFPERGVSKIPVYMVCSGSGLEIYRPFEKYPKKWIGAADVTRSLTFYLDNLDHTTHTVVLLVRPTGVAVMNWVVELLKEHSFVYGRDPLEEGLEVSFEGGATR